MRSRWLEVVVITVAAPVIGSLVAPNDAYLLHAPFPWLVLAPLLVALQHGMSAGLVSAGLLSAGALWYVLSLGHVALGTLASWSIGCVLVAIIAGQLRDSARARSKSLEQRGEELQDRLERSERTRHLIQLSHEKLMERVAATRSSLVAAIDGAQRRMADARSMHELGQVLLDSLASQGNLHAASLYIAGREPTQLVQQPVASFGNNGPSSARHPLVERAFESGKLAAIVDSGERGLGDRTVLVAVPLITSARRVVGVVAVHQLPFMAFQAEHLQQVFVLAGHLTDMLFDRWAELHEQPREASAVVPRATEPQPEPQPEPVVQSSSRTWRGMPAVQPQLLAAEAESVEVVVVAVGSEVMPAVQASVLHGGHAVAEAKQRTLRFAAVAPAAERASMASGGGEGAVVAPAATTPRAQTKRAASAVATLKHAAAPEAHDAITPRSESEQVGSAAAPSSDASANAAVAATTVRAEAELTGTDIATSSDAAASEAQPQPERVPNPAATPADAAPTLRTLRQRSQTQRGLSAATISIDATERKADDAPTAPPASEPSLATEDRALADARDHAEAATKIDAAPQLPEAPAELPTERSEDAAPAAPSATSGKAEAVCTAVESETETAVSAEDPVSGTQPIAERGAPAARRSTPAPDPNRIAAAIRNAVRAPKPVKGTPIGAVKPVKAASPGGAQLRERVRAAAQARSGSSR